MDMEKERENLAKLLGGDRGKAKRLEDAVHALLEKSEGMVSNTFGPFWDKSREDLVAEGFTPQEAMSACLTAMEECLLAMFLANLEWAGLDTRDKFHVAVVFSKRLAAATIGVPEDRLQGIVQSMLRPENRT